MGILSKIFRSNRESSQPSELDPSDPALSEPAPSEHSQISSPSLDDRFVYSCHQCQAPCEAEYTDSGSESQCPHCDTPLVVPPRIGQQLTWSRDLVPATYFPPDVGPDVFAAVPQDQLGKIFCGLDVKRGNIDNLWFGGETILLDETQALKLDLDAESDRTGTLPMLDRTSILGGQVLRYELIFVKGEDGAIYCVAADGEAFSMLPSGRTGGLLRNVVTAVTIGRVRWDDSQPILREDPGLAEQYQERFERYLDLEIPKVAEGEEYDQLLIFEPTFKGYFQRYGISGSQLVTEDDFGRLLGSLPPVENAEAIDFGGEELGQTSIGGAAAIGWLFWSSGKLPGATELRQGKRQVSFDILTGQYLQIDQIVSGTFYQLYIARLSRDEFRLGYAIEE